MLAGNASVAKNINSEHTVVNRGEWLYKLTKFFVKGERKAITPFSKSRSYEST